MIGFNDLKGKTVVITGGGGVLGTFMVKAMAEAGMKVAILNRTKSKSDAAADIAKELGADSLGLSADVTDKNSLEAAKKEINEKLGPVTVLINAAGGNAAGATTPMEELTPDTLDKLEDSFFGMKIDAFQQVFDVNFLGTILPTMVFAKDMISEKNGVIVNISSMSAYNPLTKVAAYSAAKAAINNLTQWMAVHFAKVNIRVNAIAPGFFLTEQNRFLLTDEKTGEMTARGKKIINSTPMGRYGEPEELQGALLYLMSEISKFVTGIVIPVDGGFSAYSGV